MLFAVRFQFTHYVDVTLLIIVVAVCVSAQLPLPLASLALLRVVTTANDALSQYPILVSFPTIPRVSSCFH